MTKFTGRTAPALMIALLLALPAAGAHAAIQAREDSPRGWSAVAGMDPRAVRDMARTLPLSQNASGDQPWCDHKVEVEQTLSHDFGETPVAIGTQGTTLWGSGLMGTWTMVLERPDATSCVIAAGIGYSDGASPQAFFTKVGLGG